MGKEGGRVTNEPSGDELIPNVLKEYLDSHSTSPCLVSAWDGTRRGKRAVFSGNPPTPNRTGSPPDAPSPPRRKVAGGDGRERDNQSFAEKHRAEEPDWGVMITITAKHIAHAGLHPLLDWPEYNIAFSRECPMIF